MAKVKDYYLYDEFDVFATSDEYQVVDRKPYLQIHQSVLGTDVLQKLREVATVVLDDDIPF